MITRIVKLTISPNEIEKFTTLFSNHKGEITDFKGCINVELFQQDNNGSVFFTHSKWDSLNAIEQYRNSITFKTIWSSVKPLFSEKAQAWSLEQIN